MRRITNFKKIRGCGRCIQIARHALLAYRLMMLILRAMLELKARHHLCGLHQSMLKNTVLAGGPVIATQTEMITSCESSKRRMGRIFGRCAK